MKAIICVLSVFLSGCSCLYKQNQITPPNVEIMGSCGDYKLLKNGSFQGALEIIIENKKLYELCKLQNESKKKYIEIINKK